MTNVAGWNIGALAITMVLASGAIWMPALRHGGSAAESPPPVAGEALLVDHSGTPLPRANYAKIASLSSVADAILIELCEPDRIVAFTEYSAESSTKSYRFRGKPTLVGGELERRLAELEGVPLVVVQIPLLNQERRRRYGLDRVVLVTAAPPVTLERGMGRGFSAAEVRARQGAQPSEAERRALADWVVENDGSLSELQAEVQRLWLWLTDQSALASPPPPAQP